MQNMVDRPKLTRNPLPLKEQFDLANAFFTVDETNDLALAANEAPLYTGKDGLVEFIVASDVVPDKAAAAQAIVIKNTLVALISVVTAYVDAYAEKYGAGSKTDINIWHKAVSHLPLLGPSQIDSKTLHKKIKGLEIAATFLEFLVGVVGAQGSALLSSFNIFLQKQSEALKAGLEINAEGYHTIAIGASVEVGKLGTEYFFVPRINLYHVLFTNHNANFSSSCMSSREIEIKFDYESTTSVFDHEALEDPQIKKQFDDFIAQNRKAQIENTHTFFTDI